MDTMTLLDQLENLLGISSPDEEMEKKLLWLIESAKIRLKILLGGLEPPDEMGYIVIEVSVIRFNRIGSEGFSSHSVEGESLAFSGSDFDGYMDEINAYLQEQKESKKGKVRFL